MRILQVAQRTIPAVGGVELHTAMVSKKLVEMGHEVTLVVLNSLDQRDCGFGITYQRPYLVTRPVKPRLPEEEYWNGVRILRFPSKAQLFSYYLSIEMLSWLIKNIKNFDIVHTHCFRFSNNEFTVIAYLLNKLRIPLVFTCHDVVRLDYMGQGALLLDTIYRRTIGKTLINLTSRLVALTSDNAREYINYIFADPKKISIIPNGIDFEKYQNMPDPSDLFEKIGYPEQLILYIGRFISYKNPDKLIYAFKNIVQKYPKSHLLMIGKDYGMLNQCRNISKDLGNKITFIPNAPEKVKLKALALADVCVVPSDYEGFGIIALEAQASKVPIIATNRGGLKDILIHGKTGLHINPNPEDISKTIMYLLDRPYLCKNMGEEGIKFAQNFSWSETTKKLETMYLETIDECK